MIRVVDNPVSKSLLSSLRDRKTPVRDFRESLLKLSRILIYEFFKDTEVVETVIDTPIEEGVKGFRLKGNVVFVPILRAGLSMVQPALEVLPDAALGFIGTVRNEETLEPVNYYLKFPLIDGARYVLLDPMVATGGTSEHAVETLIGSGIAEERIGLVCTICAPEGVERLSRFKRLKIVTASIDEKLNSNGYIVPGLGDAGDRFCGTEGKEVIESYGVQSGKGN